MEKLIAISIGSRTFHEKHQPIIWQNCRLQLHEIGRNWTEGRRILSAPIDSPVLTQECVSIVSYVPKQLRFVPIDVIRDHLLTRGL